MDTSHAQTRADRITLWTAVGGVGLVVVTAAVVSFSHVRALALEAGESDLAAWLIPISIDGAIAAAAAVILADSRAARRSTFLTWLLLGLGLAASLAANIASAEPTPVGWAVAGWPPIALALGIEVLATLARRRQPDPLKRHREHLGNRQPVEVMPAAPARPAADNPAADRGRQTLEPAGSPAGAPAAAGRASAPHVPAGGRPVPASRAAGSPATQPGVAGAGTGNPPATAVDSVESVTHDQAAAPSDSTESPTRRVATSPRATPVGGSPQRTPASGPPAATGRSGSDSAERPKLVGLPGQRRPRLTDAEAIRRIRALDEEAGEPVSRGRIQKELGCGGPKAVRLADEARTTKDDDALPIS